MRERSEPPARQGLLQGGGGRTLRWLGLIAWALLWIWLTITLLAAGAWIAASVLAVALFAWWQLPMLLPGPRLTILGAGGALTAAVAWLLAPVLEATGLAGDLGGSATVVAALLLLPALLAVRQTETALAPSLGPVGFVLGFVPVFAGAVFAGGALAPISGWLALPSVWLGQMLLIAGTVPFAVVAAWGRLVGPWVAATLTLGAGAQLLVGALDPQVGRVPAVLAAALYAIGWAGVGTELLRRAMSDAAVVRADQDH